MDERIRFVGRYGGEGGIRTPGRSFGPYNGLANRRIQPLCHLSAVGMATAYHIASAYLPRSCFLAFFVCRPRLARTLWTRRLLSSPPSLEFAAASPAPKMSRLRRWHDAWTAASRDTQRRTLCVPGIPRLKRRIFLFDLIYT